MMSACSDIRKRFINLNLASQIRVFSFLGFSSIVCPRDMYFSHKIYELPQKKKKTYLQPLKEIA